MRVRRSSVDFQLREHLASQHRTENGRAERNRRVELAFASGWHQDDFALMPQAYDDRNERPGVKFKDADLIGVPVRLVIGAKSLAEGQVELSLRRDGEKILVPVENAIEKVRELLASI